MSKRFYQSLDDDYPRDDYPGDESRGELDLQGLTLASIGACVTSLEANLPVSLIQLKALNEIYEALLEITNEVAGGPKEKSNG